MFFPCTNTHRERKSIAECSLKITLARVLYALDIRDVGCTFITREILLSGLQQGEDRSHYRASCRCSMYTKHKTKKKNEQEESPTATFWLIYDSTTFPTDRNSSHLEILMIFLKAATERETKKNEIIKTKK